MKKLLRLFFPLSLRVRFLLATAAVVLVLSLAYGMVALIGYSVSFDKTTFRLLRGESNLFYTLAKWENNKLHVELPENIDKQSPTMTLIYDENGQLLWAQRDVPWLMKMIQPDWLKSNGFHEIEADVNDTSLLLSGDHSIQQRLRAVHVHKVFKGCGKFRRNLRTFLLYGHAKDAFSRTNIDTRHVCHCTQQRLIVFMLMKRHNRISARLVLLFQFV